MSGKNFMRFPKKDFKKRLREFYERNREKSNATDEFLNGFKEPIKDPQKKSAINPDSKI